MKLRDLLTVKQISILRDVYIYGLLEKELFAKHNVDKTDLADIMDIAAKELIYTGRILNSQFTLKKILFTASDLEKAVWKDFLYEQIEKDKTTMDVASELGMDLGLVNSYL